MTFYRQGAFLVMTRAGQSDFIHKICSDPNIRSISQHARLVAEQDMRYWDKADFMYTGRLS